MVFRTNIKSSIIERADEDLRRLLFVEDPHPEEFNYSPLILRSVNEYLLKNNKSIALGDITSREIIDSYWKGLSLPYSEDVRFREQNNAVRRHSTLQKKSKKFIFCL